MEFSILGVPPKLSNVPGDGVVQYRWTGAPGASSSEKLLDGEVVGRNLVLNPSFERGTNLWSVNGGGMYYEGRTESYPQMWADLGGRNGRYIGWAQSSGSSALALQSTQIGSRAGDILVTPDMVGSTLAVSALVATDPGMHTRVEIGLWRYTGPSSASQVRRDQGAYSPSGLYDGARIGLTSFISNTADFIRITLTSRNIDGTPLTGGDRLLVDAIHADYAPTATEAQERVSVYFDGDTPGEGSSVVINPIVNGEPETMLSEFSTPAEAHAALKELAMSDGWSGLYDPSNSGSITLQGGKIDRFKDSLGISPDLVPAGQVPGIPTPDTRPVLDPSSMGAVRTFSGGGLVSEDWPPGGSELFVMVSILPDYGLMTVGTVTGGTSEISTDWRGALFSDLTKGTLVSSAGESMYTFEGLVDREKSVLGIQVDTGEVYSGYSQVQGVEEPISAPPVDGLFIGNFYGAVFPSDPQIRFGPSLVYRGVPSKESRIRMAELLARVTGAWLGVPDDIRVAECYTTVDSTGKRTTALQPERYEQLASVTKLLTCYLARQYVPDSILDEMIPVVPQFVPEASSRQPIVQPGELISWRDAFHASLMVSHNTLTDAIASAASLRMPGTPPQPIPRFVDMMNQLVQDWGWTDAVFTTPQGRYDSLATPNQVAELLLRIYQEDPFLRGVMAAQTWDYEIVGLDSEVREGTLTNFVTKERNGEMMFPELLGGKTGDTPSPTIRTIAYLWRNPVTNVVTASVALNTGSTGDHRYQAMRDIISSARVKYGAPPSWSSPTVGAMLEWDRRGGINYVAATMNYRNDSGSPYVEPFNVFNKPRPLVYAGDMVTAQVTVRVPQDSFLRSSIKLTARIQGGGFETPDGLIVSAESAPSGNSWATFTISGEVRTGGPLYLEVGGSRSDSNTGFHVRDARCTIEHEPVSIREYAMEVVTFNVTESSQPLDSSDSSGGVGDFSVSVTRPENDSVFNIYGSGFLQRKPVRLSTRYGDILGTVAGVSETNDSLLEIMCVSSMGPLNAYNISAPPFRGRLVDLIQLYFSLVPGSGLVFTADPSLEDREVTVPGWRGELWYYLKLLCAAENLQISLGGDGLIYVSSTPSMTASDEPFSGVVESMQVGGLSEHVEVYTYDNKWISNMPVYPPGGWEESVEVINVSAGEYIEHPLELSASLESFVPPRMEQSVQREELNRSVYSIVGDDGFPIPEAQWINSGGSVEFELGEDTRSIIVKIRAASGIPNPSTGEDMRTFALAMAADSSGSRYSSIRILGSGVSFNRRTIKFPTGVSPQDTGTEVGATIDNPFLSTMGQVVQAGTLAAMKQSGFDPQMSTSMPLPLGEEWHSGVVGSLIPRDSLDYRTRTVTYTPEGVEFSSDYHLTYAALQEALNGLTYNQWQGLNEGLTYHDMQARGRNYE